MSGQKRPFRYTLRVRFPECDAQRVVFNARYGDYVDVAMMEFLRVLGWAEAVQAGELEFQLVKYAIEWQASARFDDVLEISVIPARVGETSLTLRYEFRRYGEPALLADAEAVYVNVDPATWKKQPLSSEQRTRLNGAGQGHWIDHAGVAQAPHIYN